MIKEVIGSGEENKERKSQNLAALNLSNILRYREPAPNFNDVIRHPGAFPLFTMARDSANRISAELNSLGQAVEEGTFDRQAFEVTQRQIIRQVSTDPVYL